MAEDDLSEELGIANCMIITRAFERGAAYSNTPEATYALMTAPLTNARIHSVGISDQLSTDKSIASMLGETQVVSNNSEMTSSLTETPVNPAETLVKNASDIKKNPFNNKCIPCGDRINLLGELSGKMILEDAKKYIKMWYEWLKTHMKQLLDMISMLVSWESQAIDLCGLLKFFTDFVCVPDIARILSVLMAFSMRINFDLNIVFDLILQFAAPLLQPFLSNFINILMKYIYIIVAPIECIINAIQGMLSKLDYNVLFQNIGQLDKHFEFGRNTGQVTGKTGETLTDTLTLGGSMPWINVDVSLHDGPRTVDGNFNLLGSVGHAIKKENQDNNRSVNQAADELRRIQAVKVDSRDPSAIKAQQEKIETAREKYAEAVDKRDLSAVGRVNKQIGQALTSFKSTIYLLVGMLKAAVEAIESYFKELFDELQKIMNEFFGGNGNLMVTLSSKLALAQMIGFITAIATAIKDRDLHCNDDKQLKVEDVLGNKENVSIWTDEDGTVHINEQDSVSEFVNTVIASIGTVPQSNSLGTNTVAATIESDNAKTNPDISSSASESNKSRQKLRSLIKLTGDKTLDDSILTGIDTLTTPVQVAFKCPLKTSKEDVDQINKWITELHPAF